MRKLVTKLALGLGLLAGSVATAASAAEPAAQLRTMSWPQSGVFGAFDRAALQRGFQVYQNVCQGCHGIKYLAFRNLEALGYGEAEVRAIAAQYTVMDGPNEMGEMYERPARASDRQPSPYANEMEARASNGGALPPDLSLIVKSRAGHEDYLYSLLTGYVDPPAGMTVPDGMYYNLYYPGHLIAMPPPLFPDSVTYEDGTPATIEQMAYDLTQFLAWIGEPTLEERKRTGLKVMLFLIVMTGLFLAYKRRIWADVH